MSVVIKDMQMPQGCFDCPFLYDTHICLHNLKEVWDKEGFDWVNERLEDCPLEDAESFYQYHCIRCGRGFKAESYPSSYKTKTGSGTLIIVNCPYCDKKNVIWSLYESNY